MTQAVASLSLDPPIATFLARHGLDRARLARLPGDASPRSYVRVAGEGRLLMEDRTDPVGFAAFLRLSRHLGAIGLSAPRVFGADPAVGLALIEDFGTATYGALLGRGHDEAALYELAIDTLVHLHSHPRATELTVPAYDRTLLLKEVSVFSEWFVPAFRPDVNLVAFDATFRTLWTRAFTILDRAKPTLVLRDFHIDNLMLLSDRTGVERCGLLDFQDAVTGPAEYDLMSLLQDARRDLAPGLEAAMLDRYLAAIPIACGTPDQIRRRYHLLAAQRHTRLAGQFLRLHRRDGKPGYLAFMPRVLRQMQAALEAAQLNELGDFIDQTLPGWRDAGPAFSRPPLRTDP